MCVFSYKANPFPGYTKQHNICSILTISKYKLKQQKKKSPIFQYHQQKAIKVKNHH